MKDPYILENGTLRNKLNITDYDELNKAEADIGFVKLIDIDGVDFSRFDADLFKQIHNHIFEDIFEWAGEYRTVPIYKEEVVIPGLSLNYAPYNEIDKQLKERLDDVNSIKWNEKNCDEKAKLFARKMALIWKIHPFRDGNTRTTLSYSYLFAKEHGFEFDINTLLSGLSREYDENGRITKFSLRDKFVLASLDDNNYPEPEHLAKVFKLAILERQRQEKNDAEIDIN